MSFALYMVAFLVFMAGIVWAAVVVGVPQLYIGIGILVLLALGIALAVARTRNPAKYPPNHRP